MFKSISWHQYFISLSAAVLLYYLFIWIVYFKARMPSLTGLKNKDSMTGFSPVQQIIAELKPIFSVKITRQELIWSLQLKLRHYSQKNEPGFREAINEFITAESEQKCSIHLSEEDQRVLWLG